MQIYELQNPVNVRTQMSRKIKQAVARTARRMGVPQAAVFNSLLETGLRVTHVDGTVAKTATTTTRRKRTTTRTTKRAVAAKRK